MDVIAHNIRSLFNVGAFFRNADAFGVHHLYLTGYTAAPPRPEISKTALGADQDVSWSQEQDVLGLIARLQAEGRQIVAFESEDDFTPVHRATIEPDAVLLFGNEPDGLSQELCAVADLRVRIPMNGNKTSMNVAVANGVALYAATREYVTL